MLLKGGWWVRCLERIVGSVDIYGIPISERNSSNFALWLPVRFFTPLRSVQNDITGGRWCSRMGITYRRRGRDWAWSWIWMLLRVGWWVNPSSYRLGQRVWFWRLPVLRARFAVLLCNPLRVPFASVL